MYISPQQLYDLLSQQKLYDIEFTAKQNVRENLARISLEEERLGRKLSKKERNIMNLKCSIKMMQDFSVSDYAIKKSMHKKYDDILSVEVVDTYLANPKKGDAAYPKNRDDAIKKLKRELAAFIEFEVDENYISSELHKNYSYILSHEEIDNYLTDPNLAHTVKRENAIRKMKHDLALAMDLDVDKKRVKNVIHQEYSDVLSDEEIDEYLAVLDK